MNFEGEVNLLSDGRIELIIPLEQKKVVGDSFRITDETGKTVPIKILNVEKRHGGKYNGWWVYTCEEVE